MISPFLPMLAVASEPFDACEFLFEQRFVIQRPQLRGLEGADVSIVVSDLAGRA